jgi:hypothetical protein
MVPSGRFGAYRTLLTVVDPPFAMTVVDLPRAVTVVDRTLLRRWSICPVR